MRILVIEDEQKIAGFLQRGLTEEGHQVDVVRDLAAARAAVHDETYDPRGKQVSRRSLLQSNHRCKNTLTVHDSACALT